MAQDRPRKSHFRPIEKDKHELVRLVPPLVHMSAYVTGGLKCLYHNINNQTVPKLHEQGQFTDKRGCFRFKQNLPLLAFRYKYVEIIGKGQSCIFIKAMDTFKDDTLVSIKILHTSYGVLGIQECDCIRRMNMADPWGFSSTLRLLNTFIFDEHFCMVFDLFYPSPLTHYFKNINKSLKIKYIRKAALKLLQVLGFLKRIDVIHADLKPENILLADVNDTSTLRVVDFGNAIHCVHDEVSLYYEDFELQTLLYRAPEVMFGIPFSTEIDMWSLGCILAELYTGKPLFYGKDKRELLSAAVGMFGTFPKNLFHRGKFYPMFKDLTKDGIQPSATPIMIKRLQLTGDYAFADFLAKLLRFNPDERMTPSQAARHPFLAPELGLMYMCSDNDTYSPIMLDSSYNLKPVIAPEIQKKHLAPRALLSEGTTGHIIVPTVQKTMQVQPNKRNSKANKNVIPKTAKALDRKLPDNQNASDLSNIMELIRAEEEKIRHAESVKSMYVQQKNQHFYDISIDSNAGVSSGCENTSKVRCNGTYKIDSSINQMEHKFHKRPVTVLQNTSKNQLQRHNSVLDLSKSTTKSGSADAAYVPYDLSERGKLAFTQDRAYDYVDGQNGVNQLCYASEAPVHGNSKDLCSLSGNAFENGALNLCAKKELSWIQGVNTHQITDRPIHNISKQIQNGQPLDFTTSYPPIHASDEIQQHERNTASNIACGDIKKSQSSAGLEKIPNEIVSQKLKNICRSVIEEQRMSNSQSYHKKVDGSQVIEQKKDQFFNCRQSNMDTGTKRPPSRHTSPVTKKKPRKSKPCKTTVFEEDTIFDEQDGMLYMDSDSRNHHMDVNMTDAKRLKECLTEKKAKKPPINGNGTSIKPFRNLIEPLMASTPKISRKKAFHAKNKYEDETDSSRTLDIAESKTSMLDDNCNDVSIDQSCDHLNIEDDEDGELVQYLTKITGDTKKVNSRTKTVPISAEKLRNLMDIFIKMKGEKGKKSVGSVNRVSLVSNGKMNDRTGGFKKSDENCNEIIRKSDDVVRLKNHTDIAKDCSINRNKIDGQDLPAETSSRGPNRVSSDTVKKLRNKVISGSSVGAESPSMDNCSSPKQADHFNSDGYQSDDDNSPDYQLPSMGLYDSGSDDESLRRSKKTTGRTKSKVNKSSKSISTGSTLKSLLKSKNGSQSKNTPGKGLADSKNITDTFDINSYVKSQMWPQSSFLQMHKRSKSSSSEKHSLPKNFLKQKYNQDTDKPNVKTNKPTLRGYKRKQAAKKNIQKAVVEEEYNSNESTAEDSPVAVRRPRRHTTPVKIIDFSSDDEDGKKVNGDLDNDDSIWDGDGHLIEAH
ncbi:uncharacterized protein LOC141914909 [Tubulanus polymorphus]|uniref:uncharacterized protein LOC141914909 n=1 Tax=Tubulanus polymorphus TaxID=672921 RepID=UPI003DA56D2E